MSFVKCRETNGFTLNISAKCGCVTFEKKKKSFTPSITPVLLQRVSRVSDLIFVPNLSLKVTMTTFMESV